MTDAKDEVTGSVRHAGAAAAAPVRSRDHAPGSGEALEAALVAVERLRDRARRLAGAEPADGADARMAGRVRERGAGGQAFVVTAVGALPREALGRVLAGQASRRDRDSAEADRLRDEPPGQGRTVEDPPDGATLRRRT